MGLLDTIAEKVKSVRPGTGQESGLMDVVMDLVNNPETGGIQGLIKTFQDKGLGNIIASWISTGPNLPISAEQIQSVFGNAKIQAIAQQIGMDPQTASSGIANLLPTVIDKLTPNGTVPEGGMLEKLMAQLKGLGKLH